MNLVVSLMERIQAHAAALEFKKLLVVLQILAVLENHATSLTVIATPKLRSLQSQHTKEVVTLMLTSTSISTFAPWILGPYPVNQLSKPANAILDLPIFPKQLGGVWNTPPFTTLASLNGMLNIAAKHLFKHVL